jgi:sulfate adenylyltransferase subunit 2
VSTIHAAEVSTASVSDLDLLEAESIHIIREAAAEFRNPAMLYSAGKDSSVMLHLAQKAFWPARIPFPMVHVDTTYKFQEMIGFRDQTCARLKLKLIVSTNNAALKEGANPFSLGTSACCKLLKTDALLSVLREHSIDGALGGARREEEKSRAKERIFSFRDANGQWNPRKQRPELWALYNGRARRNETVRVFPLSNWTELDIWRYVHREQIPVVSLYFAQPRAVIVRGDALIIQEPGSVVLPGDKVEIVTCRMRSLGCIHCTGALRSNAASPSDIIDELRVLRRSERENRLIDHDQDSSMELKKAEGYF